MKSSFAVGGTYAALTPVDTVGGQRTGLERRRKPLESMDFEEVESVMWRKVS